MNTLAKLVTETINELERQNEPQAQEKYRLLPRQPPPTMEWSDKERQRLTTFMGQATRYRKRSLMARLFGWIR